jgi:hypothetical protein
VVRGCGGVGLGRCWCREVLVWEVLVWEVLVLGAVGIGSCWCWELLLLLEQAVMREDVLEETAVFSFFSCCPTLCCCCFVIFLLKKETKDSGTVSVGDGRYIYLPIYRLHLFPRVLGKLDDSGLSHVESC